jgi:hypothetical protein
MADVLWLDSSVLRQLKRSQLRALASLAGRKGVRIVVHAHIHLELCRHLRGSMRARGEEFTPSVISTSLDQLGIAVADAMLGRAEAEAWAALLDQRHPDDAAWQEAKLESVKARLPEGTRLRLGDVPMTTDWLVALEVERQGARAAVDDKGPEWRALREAEPCRALSYTEAVQWLKDCADQ